MIAITGAAGRLGKLLLEQDWNEEEVVGWIREKHTDLSREDGAFWLFDRYVPRLVIHCASATDLVRCEKDRQYCWDNVAMPAINVARACVAYGIRLVHVSTDYIFSGDEPTHPIPPETRPDPVNYYAMAKVAAESAARVVPNHLIFRTTMKERGPWKHQQAPTDMWMSHSYYDEVAPLLRDAALSSRVGIMQSGVRDINVYDFAKLERPDVEPVLRADIKDLRLPGDIRMQR